MIALDIVGTNCKVFSESRSRASQDKTGLVFLRRNKLGQPEKNSQIMPTFHAPKRIGDLKAVVTLTAGSGVSNLLFRIILSVCISVKMALVDSIFCKTCVNIYKYLCVCFAKTPSNSSRVHNKLKKKM